MKSLKASLPGLLMVLLCPGLLLAQGTSPWTDAVGVLETAFTGPIALGYRGPRTLERDQLPADRWDDFRRSLQMEQLPLGGAKCDLKQSFLN